jgi:hypothetical protein
MEKLFKERHPADRARALSETPGANIHEHRLAKYSEYSKKLQE